MLVELFIINPKLLSMSKSFISPKYWAVILVSLIFLVACKKKEVNPTIKSEVEGLHLVTSITDSNHVVKIYSAKTSLYTGYNELFIQLEDKAGTQLFPEVISWKPEMHMMQMSHGCPASDLSLMQNTQGTYQGFIVFQMASNDSEFWNLAFEYILNGNTYQLSGVIDVKENASRVVASFMGSDNMRYVLAYVAPQNPIVAVNDMQAVLYTMGSSHSFEPVSGYTIKIDPRMPGMNNHSSPNNEDLKQVDDIYYNGKLSLTMTGYWRINLQVLNAHDEVIQGSEETEANPESNIYFDLSF